MLDGRYANQETDHSAVCVASADAKQSSSGALFGSADMPLRDMDTLRKSTYPNLDRWLLVDHKGNGTIRQELEQLEARLRLIATIVDSSPEKGLALPLLRRDIEHLSDRLEGLESLQKWLIGLVVSQTLGFAGLAMGRNAATARRGATLTKRGPQSSSSRPNGVELSARRVVKKDKRGRDSHGFWRRTLLVFVIVSQLGSASDPPQPLPSLHGLDGSLMIGLKPVRPGQIVR